jgi:transcriptional regulator with XRE-family HTH domain
MNTTPTPIGEHLKTWRQRRRMSQLDLALDAEISTRHLSFIETGRARPSRDMVLHIAEQLEIPLRERNVLLLAAGYAPEFPERALDDPALEAARRAVDVVLKGHEPFPALAIDRHWTLVAANRMIPVFLAGIDEAMLQPPLNVVRLSLHPDGLASRIVNYRQWRQHILERLRHQIDISADPVLIELLEEVSGYPFPDSGDGTETGPDLGGVAIPLQLRTDLGILSAYTTTTMFGTPIDVTLSELAIESFFPADAATTEALRGFAESLDDTL